MSEEETGWYSAALCNLKEGEYGRYTMVSCNSAEEAIERCKKEATNYRVVWAEFLPVHGNKRILYREEKK